MPSTPTFLSTADLACSSSAYCLNSGVCTRNAQTRKSKCHCPRGFSGERCERKPLMLVRCNKEHQVCMNDGACGFDPESNNTFCIYSSHHIQQTFQLAQLNTKTCESKTLEEVNASNLRLYTIIGIILGCCALVGVAAMTVIKTRTRRRKKSKKGSRKSPASAEEGEGQNKEHGLEMKLRRHDTAPVRRSPTSPPIMTPTKLKEPIMTARSAEDLHKAAARRQSDVLGTPKGLTRTRSSSERRIAGRATPPRLTSDNSSANDSNSKLSSQRKHSSPQMTSPRKDSRSKLTSPVGYSPPLISSKVPAPRQVMITTSPPTPPTARTARLADLTEQLLGLQRCERNNKQQQNEQGAGNNKYEINGNIRAPAIVIGAADEKKALLSEEHE